MPSRPFPPSPSPNFFTKNRVLFLSLTISSSLVIFCSVFYFLYHLWHSIDHRAKTTPFHANAPLKLQSFSYKELKQATNGFHTKNVIGKGGSSTVFKGTLQNGNFIAVKRLDSLSLQTEQEFQNELQILGGLRSPFLVTLLGYCVEKNNRALVFEYMPKRSLQDSLFGDGGCLSLSWEKRFLVILDVARALEFLHLGCDPPVIHGDIKPSNVLLDEEHRGKISDFGLSRIKMEEGEFGGDLFSQDLSNKSEELWKSQEFSGNLTAENEAISTPVECVDEVDFALALQASSSSKNSRAGFNFRALNLSSLNYNASVAGENETIRIGNAKGKEISTLDKFVPCDDEFSGFDCSKELGVNFSIQRESSLEGVSFPQVNEQSFKQDCFPWKITVGNQKNVNVSSAEEEKANEKQWGKDWWWRQDESGELCSKDYVMEWLGSQICDPSNPDWVEEKQNIHERTELENSSPVVDKPDDADKHDNGVENKESREKKKNLKKMQEWWKEEHLADLSKKSWKLKNLQTKWKKGFKVPNFHVGKMVYLLCRCRNFKRKGVSECNLNREFSFRRTHVHSNGSDMWSGDIFSSTTSMRGTMCYAAPEYGVSGFQMEKADIYSLGVLILVTVSGRRPLHVLESPMKLEKANLISWCRHLAQSGGDISELVDERLNGDYKKEQASLCLNIALCCLQKTPESRPDIGDIVKILKGDMDLPSLPFQFSPSPPSKLYSKSRRIKQNCAAE